MSNEKLQLLVESTFSRILTIISIQTYFFLFLHVIDNDDFLRLDIETNNLHNHTVEFCAFGVCTVADS